jgi:hypothetical protein
MQLWRIPVTNMTKYKKKYIEKKKPVVRVQMQFVMNLLLNTPTVQPFWMSSVRVHPKIWGKQNAECLSFKIFQTYN